MSASARLPLTVDTFLFVVLTMAHLYFNPVSSALVVTFLAIYVAVDWFFPLPDSESKLGWRDRWLFLLRFAIVLFVISLAVLGPASFNIIQRRVDGPATHAQDGMIQTEAAVRFLLEHKNPYSENYLNTPMADFKGGEPPFTTAPLYHNAYLPFLFIASLPFYLASQNFLGWYDERFFYLLTFIGLVLFLPALVKRPRDKLALLAAFGLNFLFAYYVADGRNDVVILFELVLCTYLLKRNWVPASALVLGLAMATKHSAWFFVPFYLVYLLPPKLDLQALKRLAWQVLPMAIIVLAILLPFVLWDASAFFEDTVSYVIGTSASSFPIKGWGISTLLVTFGIIPSPESSFPFGILEALFGLPVLALLLFWQRRDNTLARAWISFAVFSFVVEYLSRFFNDNYFVFVLQAFVIGFFIAPERFKGTSQEESGVPAVQPAIGETG